jgi:DNA-binding transcriptional regulator GbsR (MarR family)
MTGGDNTNKIDTAKLVYHTYNDMIKLKKTNLENNIRKNIRELKQLQTTENENTNATDGNTTQTSIKHIKGEINEQLKNLGFDVTIC